MTMLIDASTRVIVQGITGHHGSFHTKLMLEYGTTIVAGVTPGKGGEVVEGVPVFNHVEEAVQEHPADWALLFVPALFVLEAAMESLAQNLHIVIISEHVPVYDVLKIVNEAKRRNRRVIGPNCPGLITPGESKLGIMPGDIFKSGSLGVLSRSGTLTYEIVAHLSGAGIGQSSVVGIGGDMVIGFQFVDGLKMLEEDKKTDKILLIGEIGGDAEEQAAAYIQKFVKKPVVAYVAGRTAPPGKTMGHAGAIISGSKGGFISKKNALEAAGVQVALFPHDVPRLFH